MKHYTLPAFVLLLATLLFAFAILQSFERAARAASELAAQNHSLDLAREQLASMQKAVTTTKEKGAPAAHFLDKWTAELNNESNIEHIFGQLDNLAVTNLLSPSGKNFALNNNYFFNARHLSIQNVNITVAGDYYRTLNWLGTVESTFPMARVEQISYTTTSNTLSLAVRFVFPRKFDTE